MPVVCSDERGPSLPLSRICELLRSGSCRGRSILFSLQWEGVCLEWLVWDRKTAGSAGDIVARLLAFNRWQMPPGQPKAEPTQCRDLGKDPWESERQVFASIGTGNKLAYRQGSRRENIEHAQINCRAFTLYLGDLGAICFPLNFHYPTPHKNRKAVRELRPQYRKG